MDENQIPPEEREVCSCDGENHYDSQNNFIESCPEAGTFPNEDEENSCLN